MSNNNNSADYRFGVNLPAPYNNGNTAIASASVSPSLNKGCGMFGALTSLTASFNVSAMENLGMALASNVPILLLCYASQTMCDAYKFARNLANAAASLNTASCQQIEKMAMNTGTDLRKDGVQNCINSTPYTENTGNPGDPTFETVVSQCEGSGSNNPISNFLNVGGTSNQFNLSTWVNNAYPPGQYPMLNSTLKLITGDITFSGNGIAHTTPQRGIETMQSTYSQQYYNAIQQVIENAVSSNTVPSTSDLSTISVPGYPMTQYFASKLMVLPANTRNSLYSQYATVAGTIMTLTKIQDLEDALETAKANGAIPSQTVALQGEIDKLKTRIGFLEQQLDIQKNYLTPMIASVIQYNVPAAQPSATQQEIQTFMPAGISSGN